MTLPGHFCASAVGHMLVGFDRAEGRLTVANFAAQALVGGALALMPAAAAPAWADDDLGFGGPAVQVDAYNEMLAVPISALDVRFSGPLVHFDPYNAILAAAVLSVSAADLYARYAFAYLEFGGPAVEVDAYNEALATPASAIDVRFSGRLVQFDPYNATLAATVLRSVRTVTAGDLYGSYAFAPGNGVSRLWEGPSRLINSR
jgi:hypothetical protein